MLQLPRALRALFVCVVSLLAANAAVVVTHLAEVAGEPAVAIDAPVEVAVQDTVVRAVALITTADGRTIAVDPSTPEGQAAIAGAVARGDVVETREVSMPVESTDGEDAVGSSGYGGGPSAGTASPLSAGVLEEIARQVTSPTGGGTPGTQVTLPPTPSGDQSPAEDVLGGVVEDATELVEGVTETVDSVVEDVLEVVEHVADGTTVSVPNVPVTVTTPPVTVPPVTVTTPPVTVAVPVATTVVTLPPVTVTVTLPPLTVPPLTVPPLTVPPLTVPPLTVPTTLPPIGGLLG